MSFIRMLVMKFLHAVCLLYRYHLVRRIAFPVYRSFTSTLVVGCSIALWIAQVCLQVMNRRVFIVNLSFVSLLLFCCIALL